VSLTTVPRYVDAMLKLSINIDVDNLEKGVAFYTEAFGLTPLRRFGTAAVELGGAQAPIYILHRAPARRRRVRGDGDAVLVPISSAHV
jgi:catechol 2,3-dioxygenase-like lactoylglutathione lyase family enzyme